MEHELDRRLLIGTAGLVGVAALARAGRAGPLEPPSGPVAATGKTLTEIEPRRAVQSLSSGPTYTITQPGSYYLTRPVSGTPAIIIDASNVTLDLSGFAVESNNASAGLEVLPGNTGVVIEGGVFVGVSMLLRGAGVVRNCSFRGVVNNACILLAQGADFIIDRCDFHAPGSTSSAVLVGSLARTLARGCRMTGYGLGASDGGTLAAIDCVIESASFGYRILNGSPALIQRCIAINCGEGFSQSGGTNATFVGNLAKACTTPFVNVPNSSSTLTTAGPWMNVSAS